MTSSEWILGLEIQQINSTNKSEMPEAWQCCCVKHFCLGNFSYDCEDVYNIYYSIHFPRYQNNNGSAITDEFVELHLSDPSITGSILLQIPLEESKLTDEVRKQLISYKQLVSLRYTSIFAWDQQFVYCCIGLYYL